MQNRIKNRNSEELVAEINRLKKENKQLKKHKTFGLVWEDKQDEDVVEMCKTHLPVLKEVKKRAISKEAKAPTNVIIEGDNYHSLSVLAYTHQKAVDVIYIDPPYNTGDKSWKYNNRYVDNDDTYRHSKWLSFMSKRLRIAKKLLKKDGSIIVAIDDYEVHHLGLLLEELFPAFERDLVIVEHHPQGAGSNTISRTHEYAFVCTPPAVGFRGRRIRKEESKWSLKRSGQGENNWRANRPRQFFAILVDEKDRKVVGVGPEIPKESSRYPRGKTKEGYARFYPIDREGKERVWRYNRDTMSSLIQAKVIEFTERGSLSVKKSGVNQVPVFSIWKGARYNAGTSGSALLTEIMGSSSTFPYPKSLWTTYDMLDIIVGNNPDAVILDYFAGSGTTGHAVLEMNKEDEGRRKFILCTNNENGIADDVTFPRIRNVMNGFTRGHRKNKGLGGNLKYFKTDFVDRVITDRDKRDFVSQATEMLCLSEDTYDKVVHKKGKYAIYENSEQATAIIYDEEYLPEIKGSLQKVRKPIVVYIFSYDNSYQSEDFTGISGLLRVKPIPAVILNVYAQIAKESRRKINV